MTDVLGYLNSKGLPIKKGDARNVHTQCIFCDEDPSSRGRLYINIDPTAEPPGLWMCHLCQAKGNLTTLKHHFGDSVGEEEINFAVRSEIFDAAAGYYHDLLIQKHPEAYAYLGGPKRGLQDETITSHRLGYASMDFVQDVGSGITARRPRALYQFLGERFSVQDILATGLCAKAPDRDVVYDALGGMITIPYITAGSVVAIRGRTWPMSADDFEQWGAVSYDPPKAKYKTCGGTSARLFNSDSTWEHDEVFLCEGEMDALVLEQNGYPAIGVPGANSWQDPWDDYIKGLKRIWLIFDRDTAGEKAAGKLIDRFGTKVKRIHLSEEGVKCDPTMWFADPNHSAIDFDDLVVAARRGGLLITVDEAVEEFDQYQGQEGLKFDWEKLDVAINPGLMAGQLMILLAKTGTGKTIMLLNLMHRMRTAPGQRNLRILFVSLEQTRGEWWDRARRIHTFYDLDSSERDVADYWRNNMMIIDKNRLSETELRQAIDDFEYELGKPDVILVDYLGYWARAFRGEAYERTSQAVMALKGIGKDYRVPIITPHQVSRLGIDGQEFGAEAARDSGAVEETGDFVLPLWSPDNAMGRDEVERTGTIHMRIAKSRHGGRGTLLALQFAPVSLVMVPDLDPLCGRARQEYGWHQQYKDDWARVVHRHRTGDEGHLEVFGDGFRLRNGNPKPERGDRW